MRALAIAALVLTACSPRTEVLVKVTSELAVPAQLQSIRISVTNPDSTDPTRVVYDSGQLALCGSGVTGKCQSLPLTVDLTPGSDLTPSVRVEVDAFVASSTTPIIVDASVFHFVRGQSQQLDFDLSSACLQTTCGSQGLTCAGTGGCSLVYPSGGAEPVLHFDSLAFDYGGERVGMARTMTFTLENDGTRTSGPVAISLSGDPDYAITTNDCQGIPLGPPCTVGVTLLPTSTGSKSATLVAKSSPGGTTSIALTNTTGTLPSLASTTTTHDFGAAQINVADPNQFAWTVTNTGTATTGTISIDVTGSGAGYFTTASDCPVQLAGGASCTVNVIFTPTVNGILSATVTVSTPSADQGGAVSLDVMGSVGSSLTVSFAGTGGGSVAIDIGDSTTGDMVCKSTCTYAFQTGTQLTLRARTTNGSNSYFSGWLEGLCSGSFRDCTLTLASSGSVEPLFQPITSNLVFVSSMAYPANLGGVAQYDAACNTLATAAGINDAAGDAYIAWMSQPGSIATTRLGSAAGFTRIDGRPVADTVTALLDSSVIFNPISVTEVGTQLVSDDAVWTGTTATGNAGTANCASWSSTSNSTTPGVVFGGPQVWTQNMTTTADCSEMHPIYCFMNTQVATVAPASTTGKRIWWTVGFRPGGGIATANSWCVAHAPTGVTAAVALLATSTTAPSTYLVPTTSYLRVDGTLVGTGAELAEGNGRIEAGPWQNEAGTYEPGQSIWTGSPTPNVPATSAAQACNDWTTTTSSNSPIVGEPDDGGTWWNTGSTTSSCGAPFAIYCVEQ